MSFWPESACAFVLGSLLACTHAPPAPVVSACHLQPPPLWIHVHDTPCHNEPPGTLCLSSDAGNQTKLDVQRLQDWAREAWVMCGDK